MSEHMKSALRQLLLFHSHAYRDNRTAVLRNRLVGSDLSKLRYLVHRGA
jgi:hypothetical protein